MNQIVIQTQVMQKIQVKTLIAAEIKLVSLYA